MIYSFPLASLKRSVAAGFALRGRPRGRRLDSRPRRSAWPSSKANAQRDDRDAYIRASVPPPLHFAVGLPNPANPRAKARGWHPEWALHPEPTRHWTSASPGPFRPGRPGPDYARCSAAPSADGHPPGSGTPGSALARRGRWNGSVGDNGGRGRSSATSCRH